MSIVSIQASLKLAILSALFCRQVPVVPKTETTKGSDILLGQSFSATPNSGKSWKVIFPGTVWCGEGDNSGGDYNKLGTFNDTDACCRDHDHCSEIIETKQEGHGLKNTGAFTRLSCDCDEKFYKCLKAVNSKPATTVGNTYFNLLGPECFKEAYPSIKCKKCVGRCVSYTSDKTQKKRYQWFDNKYF